MARFSAKKSLKVVVKDLSGQFTQLMIFLLLLFVLRPGEQALAFSVVWHIVFALVLLSAVYNCHHSRVVKILVLTTMVPALLCNWLGLIYGELWVIIVGHIASMLFLIISTWSILHLVIVRARVTAETLRGAICVYFMIGYFFTLIYTIIQLLNPEAFSISHIKPAMNLHSAYLSEMVYFSFVTLLSIGYGDIVPISNIAESFSIIEGVIGHFYLAILVARLVAVYSFHEGKELIVKEFEKLQQGKSS